tara:strand:+ start:357 stop:1106 length:750 start_codon:yes stop_codon:yes gene_type:complete
MKKSNFFFDKYVLVTGSSSGIGFQIAKDFLTLGAKVAIHYNQNKKGINKLFKFSNKNKCKVIKANLAKSKDVSKLWNTFLKWSEGNIDILVNNAGYVKPMNFDKLSLNEWDKCFAVNLKAPFYLSQAAIKTMSKKNNGRIINISSGGWQYGGGEKTVHYSISKAALEALTITTAKIGAKNKVLVNCIRPGATKTDFHKKIGRTNLNDRANLVPLKRMAKTDEISNAVIFLCGEKSSFITNSILDIRGGE